jgi:hypothetical protein
MQHRILPVFSVHHCASRCIAAFMLDKHAFVSTSILCAFVDCPGVSLQVATFFAVMKDTDWVQKKTFVTNFWHDWSKLLGKNHIIQKLSSCDFTPIYEWHLQEKERKKNMTSEVSRSCQLLGRGSS